MQPPETPTPLTAPQRAKNTAKKGTLAAAVGITAASLLFQLVPSEESGRKVQVAIANDGTATITNVSGREYLRTYLDIAGVATACDGLTHEHGAALHIGQHFSEQQCTDMLQEELVAHAQTVMRCTPFDKDRQPYQIVAAVDFDYNTGAWCRAKGAQAFRAHQWTAMCDALLPWDKSHVHGALVVVPDLRQRREREWETCTTGLLPGKTPANRAQRVGAVK